MVSKDTRELLDDFIGEEVSIITDMRSVVQTENGEMAEIPYVIEGNFLDYDGEYLLVGSDEDAAPELINKARIISVKLISKTAEIMHDPNKPLKAEMN